MTHIQNPALVIIAVAATAFFMYTARKTLLGRVATLLGILWRALIAVLAETLAITLRIIEWAFGRPRPGGRGR